MTSLQRNSTVEHHTDDLTAVTCDLLIYSLEELVCIITQQITTLIVSQDLTLPSKPDNIF